MTTNTKLTVDGIINELNKCGITHVVWLPTNETGLLQEAFMKSEIKLIPVCREGEAAAIAAGLILGGKKPVVFHQSTGFFESGDSVRGIALDLDFPLLMLIGYRGWKNNAPLTDSAAIYLEPILDTWGIKHHLVKSDEDLRLIPSSYQESNDSKKPVAVLICGECV